MLLKPVLDVRELPPSMRKLRQSLPSLSEFTSPTPSPAEQNVLSYLSQGVCCGMYGDPLLARDVLKPNERASMTAPSGPDGERIGLQLTYTDGTWVWWGALLYYVEKYHLRLPKTFLDHAERNGWRIDRSSIDLSRLDDSALDAAVAPVSRA
jgi:hypothetical protein